MIYRTLWGSIACLILLSTISCRDKRVTYQEYQITVPRSEASNIYPIVHDELAVLTTWRYGQHALTCIDLSTGQTVWNWVDSNGLLANAYYNLEPAMVEYLLILPFNTGVIAFDITTGQEIWRRDEGIHGNTVVSTCENDIVRSYYDVVNRQVKVIKYDTVGNSTTIQTLPMLSSTTLVGSAVNFDGQDGSRRFFMGKLDYEPNNSTVSQIYSWFQGEQYDSMHCYSPNAYGYGLTKQPVVVKNLSYWIARNEVFCVELNGMEELWRTKMPSDMLGSRLIAKDAFLYFAAENDKLYQLDRRSGVVLDSTKIAGTPSRLMIGNEFLYLVCGSNSALYQISLDSMEVQKACRKKLALSSLSEFNRTFYMDENVLILADDDFWVIQRQNDHGAMTCDDLGMIETE